MSGNLKFGTKCSARWSDDEETRASVNISHTCMGITVPDELIEGTRYCKTSFRTGCKTSWEALLAGMSESDLVLLVSAKDTTHCLGGGTVAYATSCVTDDFGRPIYGAINVCPSAVDVLF